MIFEPETISVDVELEISRLILELEDLRRDKRVAMFFSAVAVAAIYGAGPAWLQMIERIEGVVLFAGLVVLVGVTERITNMRINQVVSEIAAMKLWANAYEMDHRRTMRVVQAIEGKDTP